MNIKEAARNHIIKTYEQAKNTWTKADWTHELVLDGKGVLWGTDELEEKTWPKYCNGQDGPRNSKDTTESWGDVCEYCADAKDHAKLAEEFAEIAVNLIKQDKWNEAENNAYIAYTFEMTYGDAPTWRPLLQKIEQAKKLFEEEGIPFN